MYEYVYKFSLPLCLLYLFSLHVYAKDGGNKMDPAMEYFVETLDTMHCFFIHSFDSGFRIRTNEINNILKEEKKNNDDEQFSDDSLLKINNLIATKRRKLEDIRGADTMNKTKFVSDVTKDSGLSLC